MIHMNFFTALNMLMPVLKIKVESIGLRIVRLRMHTISRCRAMLL
jgi:hypothetical protein